MRVGWRACLLVSLTILTSGRADEARLRGDAPKAYIAWRLKAPRFRRASFSSDSKFVGVVHKSGLIACYDLGGDKRFSILLPDARAAVIAPGGAYGLAFSMRDPSSQRVFIFNSTGRLVWQPKLSGAIWCADACQTRTGARFVVGTGKGYVYVLEIGKRRRRYARWRAPGAVVSIGLDSRGSEITVGTWQESSVLCALRGGRRIWKNDAPPVCLQYVQLLASSSRLLVRSIPNRSGSDGEFNVLDRGGKRIWGGPIEASGRTRVICSPNGRYVCVGSTRSVRHKGESVRERHALLYDAYGRQLWDRGSLFFDAAPILVTSGGWVLVESSGPALYWINPKGGPQRAGKLSAAVVWSAASRDGSRALVFCRDGTLCVLRIAQASSARGPGRPSR